MRFVFFDILKLHGKLFDSLYLEINYYTWSGLSCI